MNPISTYAVTDKIEVKTPYSSAVVDQCRRWAGKFNKTRGWLLPLSRLADVRAQLGEDFSDLVEVEVRVAVEPKTTLSYDERQETGCETLSEAVAKFPGRFDAAVAGRPGYKITDNCYHLGWHVIASRRGRDNAADVYADLVDGEIPDSGGSVNNPTVSGKRCAFRLWVPRDFAAVRGLTVVTDPRASSSPTEPANPFAAFTDDQIRAEFVRRGLTV